MSVRVLCSSGARERVHELATKYCAIETQMDECERKKQKQSQAEQERAQEEERARARETEVSTLNVHISSAGACFNARSLSCARDCEHTHRSSCIIHLQLPLCYHCCLLKYPYATTAAFSSTPMLPLLPSLSRSW